MRILMGLAAAAAMLGACGGEVQQQPKKEAKAAKMTPGLYEVTGTVKEVRSTDNTTPATSLKANAALAPVRACIAADGTIEPKMFAEGADTCTEETAYVSRGRLNLQLKCNRAGKGGIMQQANGTFTADGFEAEVLASSFFGGTGDYAMTRTVTGKRVGDCPATGAN